MASVSEWTNVLVAGVEVCERASVKGVRAGKIYVVCADSQIVVFGGVV